MSDLTAARLHELLSYNHITGVFIWRIKRRNHMNIGDIAGRTNSRGYCQVQIDRRLYYAHRLAWLYMEGSWPVCQIDHINGNRSDNRRANLRQSTPSTNAMNKRVDIDSSSGFKGVWFWATKRKWRASIKINGKGIYLGIFSSPEKAHAAYCIAAKRNFGEYARAS